MYINSSCSYTGQYIFHWICIFCMSLNLYFPCFIHCIHIFHAYFTESIFSVFHCIHFSYVYFTESIFSVFHCIHIFHAYFTELIVYVFHCIHIFHVYFTASIFSMYISLHPYFPCIYFTVSTCSIFHSPSSST